MSVSYLVKETFLLPLFTFKERIALLLFLQHTMWNALGNIFLAADCCKYSKNHSFERYQDLAQSSEAGGKVIEPVWVTNIGMDWMALDVTTLQITK